MNYPHQDFEKASCREANVEKGLLVDLFDKIRDDRLDVHAIVFVKDGNKVFDAYARGFGPGVVEETYSCSKSFVSIAVGILADRGLLSIDDPILRFFPEVGHLPVHATMTVRHLLTMTSGHAEEGLERIWKAADPVAEFFQLPVVDAPGTQFFYDNASSFLLSAIVTAVTGKTVNDFLGDLLWDKLEIPRPAWKTIGRYNAGATGLALDAISLAKFGHLLLNDGVWRGDRIVSAEYVRAATSFQIPSGEALGPRDRYGYGYQFWINDFGDFRMAGMFKQYVVVDRAHAVVFAIQAYESRELLDLFSSYVLPACRKGWVYDNFTLRNYIARFREESAPILNEEKRTRTW
ncbi:MAG: serine hydrolase [Candidatus Izemoplasmatales bacterium]